MAGCGRGRRVASCTPSHANGAPQDGAACPRVPPVRAYGAARSRGWGPSYAPLSRECGTGDRVPLRALLPRVRGGAVGRCWGGVPLVRAPSARMGRAARSKGEGRGRWQPSCPFPRIRGGVPRAPPFHANGKGGAGGGEPSCAPFLCEHGGAAEGGRGGAGNDREREQRPSCPFPHVQGATAEGEGGAGGQCTLVHPAFRASGAGGGVPSYRARSRGKRSGRWRRGGRRAPHLMPICAQWRREGSEGRVPPFHANGVAQRGNEKGQGRCGEACPCAPPFRANGVQTGEKGGQAAAGVWSMRGKGASACVPFGKEGGRRGKEEGAEAKCACHVSDAHLFSPPRRPIMSSPSSHPPRLPISALPICERGRPTSPSPTPRAAPFVRRQERGAQGRGAHEGTRLLLLPLSPAPFLPIRTKGAPEAPPFPFARKECAGHAAAASPQSLAFPLGRGKGHKGCHRPLPSPFDRAAFYAPERGTRGHATPEPTLPIRAEGARTRGTPPQHLPTAPPRTRGRRARKGTRSLVPHSRERGAYEGPHPLDRTAPYARTGGTRGQAAPSCGAPFAWEGAHKATRLPMCRAAGPARSRCARVHRARTPPLYDLDKKM
ncbi:hypothetical protein EDB83DRAFT_2315114 [Lactarius deliciosus]|nr:hypothetical protein EDB83DRAFT_2315114 [Lactarius deliciosus]